MSLAKLAETAHALGVQPIFVAYAALIAMAVLPIYVGSRMGAEEASVADGGEAETLSKSDAYWFPVYGSGVLFGFYLLFRYLNPAWINALLTAYFAAFGVYSLTKLGVAALRPLLPGRWVDVDWVHVTLVRKRTADKPLVDARITWLHVLCFVLSAAVTAYYVATKDWAPSNLLAIGFATSAISLIQLDSFGTGMVLLAGLFVYDIFWVFGTNVMVSVARSFNVPVKLLFPRDVFSAPTGPFTMLGLGDIVIPGVVTALCLRFDQHNAGQSLAHRRAGAIGTAYPTPYFHVSLVFYLAGLLTTMAVMHTFKAAQPALLYLSPAGILAVLCTAVWRREVRAMLAFTTEAPKAEEESESESESESDESEDSDD